jgi:hypothetical protein
MHFFSRLASYVNYYVVTLLRAVGNAADERKYLRTDQPFNAELLNANAA